MHRATPRSAIRALVSIPASFLLLSPLTAQAPTPCPAGDSRLNTFLPYEVGSDYVPVTRDDALGFYVVYSGRDDVNSNGVDLNSSICILEIDPDELLIFGSGYGDTIGPGSAQNDADFDVANVVAVVSGCLGRDPTTQTVHFVAPHGHGDHINPPFIHALEDAGFTVPDISFHQGDFALVYFHPLWTDADKAKFVQLYDSGICDEEILSFDTTLGKVWFRARPGHTPGSIDLVIDVRNNPLDRFEIRGSDVGGACPDTPPGTNEDIEVHGNALLSKNALAIPYGTSDVNPASSLVVVAGAPKLGRKMTLGVDDPTGKIAIGALPLLFTSYAPDPSYPGGTLIDLPGIVQPAELLVDLGPLELAGAPILGPPWTGPGNTADILVTIPSDANLLSVPIYVQGLLWNPSGAAGARFRLTSGLELRTGT